jgi:TPR repeat protein
MLVGEAYLTLNAPIGTVRRVRTNPPAAQHYLEFMYYNGNGVARDPGRQAD